MRFSRSSTFYPSLSLSVAFRSLLPFSQTQLLSQQIKHFQQQHNNFLCVCVNVYVCASVCPLFLCSPIINFNYIIYVLFFPFSPLLLPLVLLNNNKQKIETQHKMFFVFPFVKKKTRLCRSLFSLFLCTRKLCRLTKIAHCYCSFLPATVCAKTN